MALVLVVVAVDQSRRLEFSQSIEAMFDRTDPALPPYHRLARTFGASEVVLAVYDAPDLFSEPGLEQLRGVTGRLAAIPGVASAMSLSETPLGSHIIDFDSAKATLWGRIDGRPASPACWLFLGGRSPLPQSLVTARSIRSAR